MMCDVYYVHSAEKEKYFLRNDWWIQQAQMERSGMIGLFASISAKMFACFKKIKQFLAQNCRNLFPHIVHGYLRSPQWTRRIWAFTSEFRVKSFRQTLEVIKCDQTFIHKGSPHFKKVQFFLTLFKRPLTPPPFIWTFVLFCRGCFWTPTFKMLYKCRF